MTKHRPGDRTESGATHFLCPHSVCRSRSVIRGPGSSLPSSIFRTTLSPKIGGQGDPLHFRVPDARRLGRYRLIPRRRAQAICFGAPRTLLSEPRPDSPSTGYFAPPRGSAKNTRRALSDNTRNIDDPRGCPEVSEGAKSAFAQFVRNLPGRAQQGCNGRRAGAARPVDLRRRRDRYISSRFSVLTAAMCDWGGMIGPQDERSCPGSGRRARGLIC